MSNICHRCRPTPHAVTCLCFPLLLCSGTRWVPRQFAFGSSWTEFQRFFQLLFCSYKSNPASDTRNRTVVVS